jgi:hypothetical protein
MGRCFEIKHISIDEMPTTKMAKAQEFKLYNISSDSNHGQVNTRLRGNPLSFVIKITSQEQASWDS